MKHFLMAFSIACHLQASEMEQDRWWEKTLKEEQDNYYYVGVSDGQSNLQEAMRQAYNEALKEAVKHQFGFNQKFIESFYSSLDNIQLTQEFFTEQENIQIRGVRPTKEKIVEGKNGYLVYREIEYSKIEIEKEKKRLKGIASERQILQEYGQKSKKNGELIIRTNPKGATIVLTDAKNQNLVTGTSDAKLFLPLGAYKVTVSKQGYVPKERALIVGGIPSETLLALEPLYGTLTLNVTPQDALITLDGIPVKGRQVKLQSDADYKIRIDHPDYYAQEEVINLRPNQENTIDKSLSPRPSYLSIISTPENAVVFINNQYAGKSPLIQYQVIPGKMNIKVIDDYYEMIDKDILIAPNSSPAPLIYHLKYNGKVFGEGIELPTKKKSTNSFYYRPIVSRDNKVYLSLLPLGVEHYLWSRLSVGLDINLYYNVKSDQTRVVDSRTIKTDIEEFNVVTSLMTRFYIIKNNILQLGIGPDLNHVYIDKYYSDIDTLTPGEDIYQYEKLGLGLGANFKISFGSNDDSDYGLRLDAQKIDLNNKDSNRYSLGMYWDF